jgi:hypothetical protein
MQLYCEEVPTLCKDSSIYFVVKGIHIMIIMQFRDVEFYSIDEAVKLKLIQLTKWLSIQTGDMDYVVDEYKRISADPTRKCLAICHCGEVALFVNDAASQQGYPRI